MKRCFVSARCSGAGRHSLNALRGMEFLGNQTIKKETVVKILNRDLLPLAERIELGKLDKMISNVGKIIVARLIMRRAEPIRIPSAVQL